MREVARSATASGRRHTPCVFVVSEFAMALVLLVAAALLDPKLLARTAMNLGFSPESVLTARLWLPQPNAPKRDRTSRTRPSLFYRRVLERMEALPGVSPPAGVVIFR